MTIQVVACKTEYRINPIGLDVLKPRFFWQLHSDNKGVVQSAYQIMVASSRDKLEREQADMWDSGKVSSNDSTQVPYDGKPLQTEGEYYWKVRIWDGVGDQSAWSEKAYWTMGILSRGEWKAQWIGRKAEPEVHMQPSPFLRKPFEIKRRCGELLLTRQH